MPKPHVSENDGRFNYKTAVGSTTTSHTMKNVDDGTKYEFKLKVYYLNEHNKRTIKYFESNDVNTPLICAADEKKQGNMCVDRCPDNNEEWNGNICIVTSCPTGQVIKNNECVDKPKPVQPVTPIQPHVVTPQIHEFYGGDPHIMLVRDNTGKSYEYSGTMTIGAINFTGVKGVVVAAHTLKIYSGEIFVEHQAGKRLDPSSDFIRMSTAIASYEVSGNVDAAFIPITEQNIVIGEKIRPHNGAVFDVTQGTLSGVEVPAQLHLYGNQTNSESMLLFKNATIYPISDGPVFTNMGIAAFTSVKGDSGGPVIHNKDNDAYLVGSLRGTTCILESPYEGQPKLNVTNTSLCKDTPDDPDVTYYKVFSAWENIKEALKLR